MLKPGGVFACLEFNRVTNPLLEQFVSPPVPFSLSPFLTDWKHRVYDQYSSSVIPLLGTILAGDRASYQYLVELIRRFSSQGYFARMIGEAGLATGGDFEGDGGTWRDLRAGFHAYTPT